ncbi:MAG TPA: SDR family oxidoreductase [Gammaproteobacteria bacterium]|nr:SDR family oxidoreductase [Gammaproteobacteria bacterium]
MTINKEMLLDGKTALITGASGDLGIATLEALVSMGANIVAHYYSDRNKLRLDKVVKTLQSKGYPCINYQSDLRSEDEVKALFYEAINIFKGIDIVINTAGTMLKQNLQDTTLEDYENIFDIHSKGAFLVLRQAARCLNNNGRIINISSSLTLISGAPQYSVYAAAKAASEQLTKYLASEIGHRGITVNTVSPGPLDNEFLRSEENEQSLQFLASLSPFSRLGDVSDITPVIQLLVSENARWITGQNIRVNGGIV